mmetsp:Transcript_69700/g.130085  ORF Transcript_69700/g.130085 Transcript_69700/m.130085 type:complete len:357 (-) Transcript_69700:58-1128(-)
MRSAFRWLLPLWVTVRHAWQADGFRPQTSAVDTRLTNLGTRLPCWIVIGRTYHEYAFIINPLVISLQESLASIGMEVNVAWAGDDEKALAGVAHAVEQGVTPVVISLSWFRTHSSQNIATLHKLSQQGAYMILYNTENMDAVWTKVLKDAKGFGAKEVWTHSLAINALYEHDHPEIVKRYFPPGCAAGLIVEGISQNASERDEAHLGFVGEWSHRSAADKKAYNATGRIRIHGGKKEIVSPDDWRAYLQRFPLQFNSHSAWNKCKGLEALRLAMLLANGACVFSDHSSPLDEGLWKGMVRFGDADSLLQDFESMRENPQAIRTCQEESKALFCQQFTPAKIAQQSGFASVVEVLKR